MSRAKINEIADGAKNTGNNVLMYALIPQPSNP